ncbi:hypothetical protein Mapa_001309 [Marchantia paleacea]|nr:hypothetical protein Mapa_001309 [Marchantia paleacea]
MSSGILRRRVHHEDVGGGKYERVLSNGSDGVSEPLLGADYYDQRSRQAYYTSDEDDDDVRGRRSKADQVWSNIFSRLLVQWAQWFTNVVVGSGALLGTVFFRVLRRPGHGERTMIADLSPLQARAWRKQKWGECINNRLEKKTQSSKAEKIKSSKAKKTQSSKARISTDPTYMEMERRLQQLQEKLHVPFDGTLPEHQEALKSLWRAAFANRELPGLVCEEWKEMGWQGNDPSTDFRGGGYVSLENLLFLAHKFPRSFQRLLHKQEGKRATWEYPFAVAGLNITFMLIQMLDLRAAVPSTPAGVTFCKILAEDEAAFDMLYCVAFEMMDAQWLAMHASYMEFNAVLRATRTQLERELMLEDVNRVEDLPAYSLLLAD